MGIGGCFEARGKKIDIYFDCVGKSQEKIRIGNKAKLRVPLEQVIDKWEITLAKINEVQYGYNPVNINKTIEELNIINNGTVMVKLKSEF